MRTYDEAINEGEASEMEDMIKALARALEEKNLRAKEARKEAERAREEAARAQDDVDTAQQLLDDANRKQKICSSRRGVKGNELTVFVGFSNVNGVLCTCLVSNFY